ncbi:calcium calmodulin-dependent protein kinase [Aspergillus sp. HF37]|nr:calcium calmodulin-dependent protein kinase [Aspergillus sp. HF37]
MGNSLELIKQEIAIMKKLHHNNLVSLIEVLDDPTEDSLYMVMEMCKKGVIMKVGLEDTADPYDDERCRCWFRDLILGIEYLHAQGIVHRDIKPDNCLLTNGDVLKIVDFGVSEIFEKDSGMYTAKSAGSPAFLPPELCVVRHGDVSGKAADIWSMGVTLYCLRYGKLPFQKGNIFELYEAIRSQPVVCMGETDEVFRDLMVRVLEKDPDRRITMDELRVHPWVTKNGLDPLLSEEENTAEIVSPPTEEEVNLAITRNLGKLIKVMKAVRNFKRLIDPSKSDTPMQSILGQEHESHFVEPPMEMEPDEALTSDIPESFDKDQTLNAVNQKLHERHNVLGEERSLSGRDRKRQLDSTDSISASSKRGSVKYTASISPERRESGSVRSVKRRGDSSDEVQAVPSAQSISSQVPLSRASSSTTKRSVEGTRGHARDPLEEEYPYLFIGPSTYFGSPTEEANESNPGATTEEPDSISPREISDANLAADMSSLIVSESPGAAEFDIYETAYREEVEQIRERSQTLQTTGPRVYLTRRVEGKGDVARLVEEHDFSEASQEPRSRTMPALGAKMRVHSGQQPAMGGIRALIQQQQQQQQQMELDPPDQEHHGQQPSSSSASKPGAATGDTSTGHQPVPVNPRTRLRSLLGRVRGPRG